MERRVYVTRLKPEYRDQYLEAHRNVPPDVLRRYKEAGMTHCSVHLSGDTLVLITEAHDHNALQAALVNDPIDRAWQDYVRTMKDDGDYKEMTPIFSVDF
jgi:L-rhamnose mutarotase